MKLFNQLVAFLCKPKRNIAICSDCGSPDCPWYVPKDKTLDVRSLAIYTPENSELCMNEFHVLSAGDPAKESQ